MELETLRSYLLKKQGAFEDFPFGPEVMVYKVMGKMFALAEAYPDLKANTNFLKLQDELCVLLLHLQVWENHFCDLG